jgi:hypothetical protein
VSSDLISVSKSRSSHQIYPLLYGFGYIVALCIVSHDISLNATFNIIRGPGGSVGIATDCGLDGSEIESRWRRDFPPVRTGPGAHPASCTMGTGSFPGVKCGQGVLLTTHPLLTPRSWKSRAIPLPLWPTTGPVMELLYCLPLILSYPPNTI